MDWKQVATLEGMIILANGGFVWAVKWLLSEDRKRLAADFRQIRAEALKQGNRHDELWKEVSALKESLPREFVRREDWVMSFGRIEQKIDAIWKFVYEYVDQKRNSRRE